MMPRPTDLLSLLRTDGASLWIGSFPGRDGSAPSGWEHLGAMEVPVEGIRLGQRTYLFFSKTWDVKAQIHRFSMLAHGETGDLHDLAMDWCVPTRKFINVSACTKKRTSHGDPWVYLWGTGPFRKSAVHLARVPASRIGDRSAYRFYAGPGPSGPRYVISEEEAQPLFDTRDVGELSAVWHEGLKRWILTYNTGRPPKVALRWAPEPHGPWSRELFIFKPWRDGGYTVFLHVPRSRLGYDDGLSDPGREEEWGGVYGPYLIPSYFRGDDEQGFRIRYTLSSWNPYQVHLMETELGSGKRSVQGDESPGKGPRFHGSALRNPDFREGDLSGWTADGDPFRIVREEGAAHPWLSTRAPAGRPPGALKGSLEQCFQVPLRGTHLRFELRGGHGAVKLFRQGNLVYRTFGPGPGKPVLFARWNLLPFRGDRVRLKIEDRYIDGDGYVEVRNFRLETGK